jgi:hypothetical protein
MQTDRLHKFWWLWLPVLGMGIQLFIESAVPDDTLKIMHNEGGIHEIIEFLVLLAALVVAICAFFSKHLRGHPWLRAWVGLAALCCLYVAGEEMSWGQHILQWSTPEYWQHINDQQETNLHNTSSWFDQKPRALLEIGVLIGGLVIPLLQHYKPSLVPQRFSMIYPSSILSVIALFVMAIKIADNFDIFYRGSEVLELYLFYFVLLYLIILRRRFMRL